MVGYKCEDGCITGNSQCLGCYYDEDTKPMDLKTRFKNDPKLLFNHPDFDPKKTDLVLEDGFESYPERWLEEINKLDLDDTSPSFDYKKIETN